MTGNDWFRFMEALVRERLLIQRITQEPLRDSKLNEDVRRGHETGGADQRSIKIDCWNGCDVLYIYYIIYRVNI